MIQFCLLFSIGYSRVTKQPGKSGKPGKTITHNEYLENLGILDLILRNQGKLGENWETSLIASLFFVLD